MVSLRCLLIELGKELAKNAELLRPRANYAAPEISESNHDLIRPIYPTLGFGKHLDSFEETFLQVGR
jgi:hypothetical protein